MAARSPANTIGRSIRIGLGCHRGDQRGVVVGFGQAQLFERGLACAHHCRWRAGQGRSGRRAVRLRTGHRRDSGARPDRSPCLISRASVWRDFEQRGLCQMVIIASPLVWCRRPRATVAKPSRASKVVKTRAQCRPPATGRHRPARCKAARRWPRRGSWHRPARPRRCRRRRSEASGHRSAATAGPARGWISRTAARRTGRLPRSGRGLCSPSRASVVLVAMIASRPEHSARPRRSPPVPYPIRSGAIFRKIGIGVGSPSRASITPSSRRSAPRPPADRAAFRCWGKRR